MKKVTLKVSSGDYDKIARFYDCGKAGEKLYDSAVEIMEDGGDGAREFISEKFDGPSVETFVHQLNDGSVYVGVENEDEDMIFEDEQFSDGITSSGFVTSDPRKWQFDSSMSKGLTERIKALVESNKDDIEEAVSEWKKEHGDEPFEEDFVDERFCDLADDVSSLIVRAPFVDAGYAMNMDKKSPSYLFGAMCADLYGFSMQGEIELEDDEEFDPEKLHLILHDYDGFYYACNDAVLPVVMYGNKFYQLSHDDSWEAHYEYYGFAQKKEGASWLEFKGEEF